MTSSRHNRAREHSLPSIYGNPLVVDQNKSIAFMWEGRRVPAYEGDTITSALWRVGERVLARSFKYHRPRGFFNLNADDATPLVQTTKIPNINASITAAHDGAVYTGQHAQPNLKSDKGQRMQALHHLLPAGFYYHAFFRPAALWPFWEKQIRKRAGLGDMNIPRETIESAHRQIGNAPHHHLFAEVVIVGGGKAGITQAEKHARAGKQVILIEREHFLGGTEKYTHVAYEPPQHLGQVLLGTTVTGVFPTRTITAISDEAFYTVSADLIIFATGTSAQLPPFENNDLPGIIAVEAALKLLHVYGVRPGQDVVIWGNHDRGHARALEYNVRHGGGKIVAWLEKSESIVAAHADKNGMLKSVTIGSETETRTVACDTLCVDRDLIPNLWLARQAGVQTTYANGEVMVTSLPEHVAIVGAARGESSSPLEEDGHAGFAFRAVQTTKASTSGKWVMADTDEDLTYDNLNESYADGFQSIELMKRYSTFGMGPSQGKMSVLAGLRWLFDKTKTPADPFTTRPPLIHESFRLLAGSRFHPVRTSAFHAWHVKHGAVMLDAGQWLRPAFYQHAAVAIKSSDVTRVSHDRQDTSLPLTPAPAEENPRDHTAWLGVRGLPSNLDLPTVHAEVLSIRRHVGIIDVSTLGGIDIYGAEAGAFLDRIYTGYFSTLAVGKAKYALLLTPSGSLADDGMIARIANDHFYVTTTSGMAGNVYRELQFFSQRWKSAVDIIPMTSVLAGISIAGPKAPAVLSDILTKHAVPPAQREHLVGTPMSNIRVGGDDLRVLRTGFTGEITYEVHVPRGQAISLWEKSADVLPAYNGRPVGIEAQRILRLEKGHIIIGQDSDGLTSLDELDMAWAIPKSKKAFLGFAATKTIRQRPLTRKLQGITLSDPAAVRAAEEKNLTDNCLFVASEHRSGDNIVGRITSLMYSPTLGKWIGLAFVPPTIDPTAKQTLLAQTINGLQLPVEITPRVFYDPSGYRQTDNFLNE